MRADTMGFGRRVIYTDEDVITRDNVLTILGKAMFTHLMNSRETKYLYNYYKGDQPILYRTKEIRPEIDNRIVVNRANEIVSFKTGYLVGEPIQYVNRGNDDVSKDINTLNTYLSIGKKAVGDKILAFWMAVCGVGYRMVLPNANDDKTKPPFDLYTLDPRFCFVVKYSGLGNKIMMGVKYIQKENGTILYSVYTDHLYFEIEDGKVTREESHPLGRVPIVEYVGNVARLGEFEIVLPLLDAINKVTSNRVDGIEQFVQALLVLKGVKISDKDFSNLRELGGLIIPADADAKYLIQELNQMQTQTLVDSMYQKVLTICGMPNRNGGSSTSDTGNAVIMRDGWESAEARAKDTEAMFREGEEESLELMLTIMNATRFTNLTSASIEIKFTRRNYENIQVKSQVLISMLNNDKIHPRLAFESCNMFPDPELAYTESMEYKEEQNKKSMAELKAFKNKEIQNEKDFLNSGDGDV